MAKKRAGVSRSQHVRDYLAVHPAATPNQIVAALKANGIEVSVGLASSVKYTSGPGAKRKAAGGKNQAAGSKPGRAAASSSALTLNDLVEAKKLAEGLGGIDEARKALDALASLQN